jgi:hypothetical protein
MTAGEIDMSTFRKSTRVMSGISLAVAMLFGAAAQAQDTFKARETGPTTSPTAPAGPAKIAMPPKRSKASIRLDCAGKTITLNTGTGGGNCTASGGEATCDDGGKHGAHATCDSGCTFSTGKGSCS